MEDEHIVLREGEALIVEAEDAGVFARRREETALHALELDAQDFDDVRVLDRILDALVHDDARLLVEEARQERLRTGDVDFHAHLAHAVDIGARDAAVQDVAEDGDLEAFEMTLVLLDREEVQEALRRMRVGAVTGVDDDRAHDARGVLRRALCLVAHDDGIDAHRLDRVERIAQALALDDARGTRRDVDDVRAEVLAGELERRARARARLVEQRDNGFAAQRRDLLDVTMDDVLHFLGCLEHETDLLRREVSESEDVLAP